MNVINTDFLHQIVGCSPFRVNKSSVDITASERVYCEGGSIDEDGIRCIDLRTQSPIQLMEMEGMKRDGFIAIPPQTNIIIETAEEFQLEHNVCGMYQAVGTLNTANIGVIGSIWMQPGWCGKLRITLRNYNYRHSYTLYKGAVVGQLILLNL